MLKLRTFVTFAAAGLLMVLLPEQATLAAYAIPENRMGTGTIGMINYAARTLAVNGHTYPLSPKVFVTGAKSFENLQTGMRVRYIMNGPLNRASSVITKIIVLPALPPQSRGRP